MREPKFKVGDVVRVADPDGFISSFAKKVADRDAIVIENFSDWATNTTKGFKGRVYLEFQKRNGRGKEFREVLNERYLILSTSSNAGQEKQ